MIIIIEGIDKSGKTTIAKELCKKYNLFYVKNPLPNNYYFGNDKNIIPFVEFSYLNMILHNTDLDNIVLDRWFISQFAYSKVYKDKRIDENYFWKLEKILSERNTIGFYIYKNYDRNDFKDKFVKFDKLNKLHKAYLNYLDKANIRFYTVNSTDQNLKKQIQFIGDTIYGKSTKL